MEITMNDKCISKSNGNGNGNDTSTNGNNTISPLFEVIKEEKAVSFEEQEEDDFHQDLNQHQHQHHHHTLSQSHSNSNSNSQPNQQQHISQCQSQSQSQSQSQWQQKEYNATKINDINHDNDNDNDNDEENEIRELRKRLESIRIQRRRIHESKYKECMKQQDRLLERLNIRRRDRNEIIDEYSSTWKSRDSVCLFLDCAKRWNVLNDCFYIWIDGRNEFATINGCRLGGEAFPLPSELLVSARRQQQQQLQQQDENNNNNNQTSSRSKWVPAAASTSTTEINGNNNNVDSSSLSSQQHQHEQSPPRRRLLGFFSGGNNDTTNVSTAPPSQKKVSSMISTPQQPIHVRVPWLEVNAALGHACLLLRILQESSSKNGGIGMKFTHELHPMGATSKIGIRFGKSVTASANGVLAAAANFSSIYSATTTPSYVQPVVYNLFFEESSGFNSFFKNKGLKNFNWALQAFLQCIAEAAAQQKDKTIAIPHVIRHNKQSSNNKNNTDTTNNSNSNSNSIGINDLNGGEWTIGGLPICYPSLQQVAAAAGNNNNNYHQGGDNNGMTTTSSIALEWTRACRYLLTDLKWLIAYAAKHVDR
jgi:hypothetical protein